MPYPDRRDVGDVPPDDRVSEDGFCSYHSTTCTSELEDPHLSYSDHPYHRMALRCPLCGRRLIAKVGFDDGFRMFMIPHHKPKGYRIRKKRNRIDHKREAKPMSKMRRNSS